MKFSKQAYQVFLLLIVVIFSIPLSPSFDGIGADKQVFIYGAMTIWKGGVPYKDFFDHKPPLIFLILALGWPLKAWGYFIIAILSKWIAGMFIYKAANKLEVKCSWAFPVIFFIFLLCPSLLMAGSLTREYAACFLAILFSVILINPGKRYLLSGILCGLIFQTQQEELFLAFPIVIWHLVSQSNGSFYFKWNMFIKRAWLMLLGFLIISVPLIVWIAAKGALSDYWEQTFIFNLFVYGSKRPFFYKITGTLSVLFHTRYLFFVFPALAIHLYYIVKKRNVALHLVIFSTLIIALWAKAFLGRIIDFVAIYHYLLTFSAIVTFSILIIAKEWNKLFKANILPYVYLLFIAGLFFVFWKNSFSYVKNLKRSYASKQVEKLVAELQEVKNKDGHLFVMGNTSFLAVNNRLNCMSPSKWIYTTQFSQSLNFDTDGQLVKKIIADIDKNKTRYILDFYLIQPVKSKIFQAGWEQYLNTTYKEVSRDKDYILFKRIADE